MEPEQAAVQGMAAVEPEQAAVQGQAAALERRQEQEVVVLEQAVAQGQAATLERRPEPEQAAEPMAIQGVERIVTREPEWKQKPEQKMDMTVNDNRLLLHYFYYGEENTSVLTFEAVYNNLEETGHGK